MSGVAFQKVHSGDRVLEQVQSNVERALQALAPFQAVQLERVSLVAGETNSVGHTLGRRARGFFVVRKRGPGDVWDEQDDNPNPTRTLWIGAELDVVVDLLVYG